jgi:hypothetical protein
VNVVVDEIGLSAAQHHGPDRRDARDGADGVPRVHLVAVAQRAPGEQDRWIERAEGDWGPWGSIYYDDDGRVLGSMQYGPSELFPRASELPAGPPSDDSVLVTCAYLVTPARRG